MARGFSIFFGLVVPVLIAAFLVPQWENRLYGGQGMGVAFMIGFSVLAIIIAGFSTLIGYFCHEIGLGKDAERSDEFRTIARIVAIAGLLMLISGAGLFISAGDRVSGAEESRAFYGSWLAAYGLFFGLYGRWTGKTESRLKPANPTAD